MSNIRDNSDDWSGRDPSRDAPKGMSNSKFEVVARMMFFLGCLSLVLLGVQLTLAFQNPSWGSWASLLIPASTVLVTFNYRKTHPIQKVARQA